MKEVCELEGCKDVAGCGEEYQGAEAGEGGWSVEVEGDLGEGGDACEC